MAEANWQDLGPVEELKGRALRELAFGRAKIALTYVNGEFGAVSGVCNHVGGPLGQGRLDGDYLVCPWHYWKFHRATGEGEPGFEADKVPRYALKEEGGHLFLDLASATPRAKAPHAAHPLARPIRRATGPQRVLGISTTAMDRAHPRYSTSDALLETALEASAATGAETQLLRLNDLAFRACEGFYSKSAHACTWPCSITQMDKKDQMDRVYEALVFWADVVLVAVPIRWGAPSSLYQKMVERMNCIQNQVTIKNKVLIENKVAGFIITGGQDNVQAVAGQMLMFFSEIGCQFPAFPFIAHSRGWDAEDMERNIAVVQQSAALHQGARELAERALETSRLLLGTAAQPKRSVRAGRKAGRVEAGEPA